MERNLVKLGRCVFSLVEWILSKFNGKHFGDGRNSDFSFFIHLTVNKLTKA